MAKYGDLEARPDDGQNEFSDIIKSRSGEWWKLLLGIFLWGMCGRQRFPSLLCLVVVRQTPLDKLHAAQ